MVAYSFTVEGTARNEQTWKTEGGIIVEKEGDFPNAVKMAMEKSFDQLTNGKAVFGFPGLGCSGPYKIQRLVVERQG